MSITINGFMSLTPSEHDFVRAGFLVGAAAGNWPEWRSGPTEEEMVALATNAAGPIGFATFYHAGEVERVWLDLLWVAPEHRRKSVGTRLLAAVMAYGERHSLAVEFGTSAGNAAMQALASSFGLVPYSIGYQKAPLAA